MSDSTEAFLSVDQRGEIGINNNLGPLNYNADIARLLDHAADADRIIAELRHDLNEQRTLKEHAQDTTEAILPQLAAKDTEIARLKVYGDALEHGLYQILPGVIELEMKLDPCPAVKLAQKISAYATSLAKKEFAPQLVGMLENELKDLGVLEQENERLRTALKAADRELINAVCDGAYYKPDETRMKIFRDGLREALAATQPAKPVCPACNGEGFIVAPGQENLPPWQLPLSDKCPTCDGTGRIPPEAAPGQSSKPV